MLFLLGLVYVVGLCFNVFSSSDVVVVFIDVCVDGVKVGRNNSVVEYLEYWVDGSGLSLGSGGLWVVFDFIWLLLVSVCKLL